MVALRFYVLKSCPAVSCPAILMVRHFHVRYFQSTLCPCRGEMAVHTAHGRCRVTMTQRYFGSEGNWENKQ